MYGKFFLKSKGFWGSALAILLEALELIDFQIPELTEPQQDMVQFAVLGLAIFGRWVATQPLRWRTSKQSQ